MIRIGHAYYQTPCKPLPQWLFHLMFFAIIPPMIVAMMVWTVCRPVPARQPKPSVDALRPDIERAKREIDQ
jgi:predicted small integral membrane protein